MAVRSASRPIMWSTSSIRSRWTGVRRATRVCQKDLSSARASSRFSKTFRNSNTVGFWNLRPMPACAISGSVRANRLRSCPNHTDPLSGRVLPVMTSIIVVFPAPFGPMIQSSSPGSTWSVSASSALNRSKLTVSLSRYRTFPSSTDGFRRAAASRISRHALRVTRPSRVPGSSGVI